MPALPLVPNVLVNKLHFHIAEDLAVVTRLFFKYAGGPPSSADCTTLAAASLVEAAAHLYAVLSTANSLEFCEITDLATNPPGSGTSGSGTAGSESGGPLPVGTAVLANYTLLRRYRGGKPRSYWPLGTDSDLQDGSTWKGTSVTAFDTAIADYIAGMVGQAAGTTTIGAHANISYFHGFTSVTNPITGRTKDVANLRPVPLVDSIQAAGVNGKPGNQRRRFQR